LLLSLHRKNIIMLKCSQKSKSPSLPIFIKFGLLTIFCALVIFFAAKYAYTSYINLKIQHEKSSDIQSRVSIDLESQLPKDLDLPNEEIEDESQTNINLEENFSEDLSNEYALRIFQERQKQKDTFSKTQENEDPWQWLLALDLEKGIIKEKTPLAQLFRTALKSSQNSSTTSQPQLLPSDDIIEFLGFMIPTQYEGKTLTEFLLIPVPLSCPHVPPPAEQQIILVNNFSPKLINVTQPNDSLTYWKLQATYKPVSIRGHLEWLRDEDGLSTAFSMNPIENPQIIEDLDQYFSQKKKIKKNK
jgi:hypothetical protein